MQNRMFVMNASELLEESSVHLAMSFDMAENGFWRASSMHLTNSEILLSMAQQKYHTTEGIDCGQVLKKMYNGGKIL